MRLPDSAGESVVVISCTIKTMRVSDLPLNTWRNIWEAGDARVGTLNPPRYKLLDYRRGNAPATQHRVAEAEVVDEKKGRWCKICTGARGKAHIGHIRLFLCSQSGSGGSIGAPSADADVRSLRSWSPIRAARSSLSPSRRQERALVGSIAWHPTAQHTKAKAP